MFDSWSKQRTRDELSSSETGNIETRFIHGYVNMADELESESAAALLSFKNGNFSNLNSIKNNIHINTMDIEMDEAPILGPAALGLQRVGEEMPPRQPSTQPGLVLNRRGMPARIRKKNRLFFDDDVVNTLLPKSTKRGVRGSPSKKNASSPSKVLTTPIKKQHVSQTSYTPEPPQPATPEQRESPGPATSSPDRKVGQRIGMRLRNLLKLPKAHKWVCYEWFYSNIDLPLFDGDNDFMLCLKEALPQLRTRRLTRAEWAKIRLMMGKPRRCSQAFFEEERKELERKRAKIRLLQQRKTADVTNCKDLPEEIPLQLVIGTKVTARLRKPQDGLFTGSIDAVDTSNNTYRITFERQGLGTHSVPDYEVLSNEPPETITVSSFAQKFRPRNVSSFVTPPRFNETHTPRVSDPMVGSGTVCKTKSVPSDGLLGGFPVKCLDMIVRLSKILNAKKNKIKILRDMNAEAEKKKSFGGLIAEDFQRRYANTVVELERINRDLQGYLISVQKYCQEFAPEASQAAVLAPSLLQERSHREAREMVDLAMQSKSAVKNKKMLSLLTQLTALMLQIKSLSEADRSAYEVKILQTSIEEIRSRLSPRNQYHFQNSVEVHMQHIQTGLCNGASFNPLMLQRV